MERVRWFRAFVLFGVMAVGCIRGVAQTGDPGTLAREKLVTEIKLTKPTADHTDIVTQGDVVLLHKDGLMMCSADSSYAYSNSYNNGVLVPTNSNRAKDAAKTFFKSFGGAGASSAANGCVSRKFVAGEKFWVTRVDLLKDGILVATFSDPYPDPSGNQVRYYGEIKFPFAKGSVPGPDDFVKTVSEVITVAPADNSRGEEGDQAGGGGGGGLAPAAAAASAPVAPMAPIPPPPPPADAPTATIAIGQTEAQVTSAFGQPVRQANLGTKKIYYYKDMKVTFVHGKVTDVD